MDDDDAARAARGGEASGQAQSKARLESEVEQDASGNGPAAPRAAATTATATAAVLGHSERQPEPETTSSPESEPEPEQQSASTAPLTPAEAETVARHFSSFADAEVEQASPLYFVIVRHVARDLTEHGVEGEPGLYARLLAAAPGRQRIPNVLLAAVQRRLFDASDEPLAAYYPSLGGSRAPDPQLTDVFDDFVRAHRDEILSVLRVGETQTNEVRRSAQLFPAFGWAQACTRRPLGLIEVGTSAGLLLHPDRYGYVYEFGDGTEGFAGADSAEGVPRLHCAVLGDPSRAAAALKPFVSKPLRVASRVGLDLNPLDPADPDAQAWLRALIWPEHTQRRSRLDAALEHARRRPVRLRKGDAMRILADAVAGVPADAIPCVFVSNSLAHWTPDGRAGFAALIRELGAQRDLVCIMKESHRAGLALFTGRPDDQAPPPGAVPVYHREVIAAAVYLGGTERLFRLGTAGMHGADLEWTPTPIAK